MKQIINLFWQGLPKRLFASILAVCMVFTVMPPVTATASIQDSGKILLSGFAEQIALMTPMADHIASGTSGGCDWLIDADGVLTISQTVGRNGKLASYSSSVDIPWKNNLLDVKKVLVKSGVYTNYNASWLFSGLANCTEIDLSECNTTGTQKMTNLFYSCKSLSLLTFGNNFNTEVVTDMSGMFGECESLISLDISVFDTQKVTNAGNMFSNMRSLRTLTLGVDFSTGNVTTIGGMFVNCSSLEALDLRKFDTTKVTNMKAMFQGCSKLTSLDLSSFTNPKATSMLSLFEGCTNLKTIAFGTDFSTSTAKSMSAMFKNCSSLESLDVSVLKTDKVTDMLGMFEGCTKLANLDLSMFDTSNVTDMDKMFSGCVGLSVLDLSNFDTTNLQYTSSMFNNCTLGLNTNLLKTNMNGKKIYLFDKHSKAALT